MSTPEPTQAPLFDDNPAIIDLLGFGAVAGAVVRVLTSGGLDPVTVGVQSGWGGGKSTLLNLIEKRLEPVNHVLVVRVDPWEFENSQDVRGTLIALVLNALQEELVSGEMAVPEDRRKKIIDKLNALRRRIAWGRVAQVLVTSAATMTPDIVGLVNALTPAGPEAAGEATADKPQSMAGFRQDFASLMKQEELGLTKVVVLVDDLDRCLPAAAVATLEAIKLFLSVEKMAFVLAADEDMVRASIDKHLGGLANGEFANRYTEKIVQLPILLPRLSQHDAEALVALLLGCGPTTTGEDEAAMIERARQRRRAGLAPYVVPDPDGAPSPSPETLALAATIAHGLSADTWQTPRAVKRFLNNLAIREHIAHESGAALPLGVLVRLYLLELRHLAEFKRLAALAPDARAALLRKWEEWGTEQDGAEKPPEVDEGTRAWAGGEPGLAGRGSEIDRYLSLAATLRADVRFGGALDAAQREVVERLLSEADADRRTAAEDTRGMDPEQQDIVVGALGEQLARVEDPQHAIESLVRLANQDARLVPGVTSVLQRMSVLRRLEPQHIPLLRTLRPILTAITTADGLDERVVDTARHELQD